MGIGVWGEWVRPIPVKPEMPSWLDIAICTVWAQPDGDRTKP